MCSLIFSNIFSSEITGVIKDSNTNELLVGATIYIKELKIGTMSGLDGSFKIKKISPGNYTVVCSYISYNEEEKTVSLADANSKINIIFSLSPHVHEIDEVHVISSQIISTDESARRTEQTAANIMNVVSAKSIELSPDLNVANVVQRVSGITLDKSSTGIGQYAILRGMDKRYSYTLINGIKIPSTNDDHRYVPLDIFPSDLVDRIEVTKALTPDMEGDAIAGVINLVMKNAPDKFMFTGNFSTGYSQFWSDHTCETFNTEPINFKSPWEIHGDRYRALPSDFSKANLDPELALNPYNITAGFAVGNRFFKHRLGIVLAGSFQNTYKGTQSLFFDPDIDLSVHRGMPLLSDQNNRTYSNKIENYGLHNKLDFLITPNQKVRLYTAYMFFEETQVRQTTNLDYGSNWSKDDSTFDKTYETRLRYNLQTLFNSTLQGDHQLFHHLNIQWSAVYSLATNRTPDQSTITSDQEKNWEGNTYVLQPVYIDEGSGLQALWRRNSDQDKSAYLNIKYDAKIFGADMEFSTGGLYRTKTRTSFYNAYTLFAVYPAKGKNNEYYAEYGPDWTEYSNVKWGKIAQPLGTVNDPETFGAFENEEACYGMFSSTAEHFQVKGGLRIENTHQGYNLMYPLYGYPQHLNNLSVDFLPSLHFKYSPGRKMNIRLSYYRGTNKPGFLEIVPCQIVEEYYTTMGNPKLKEAVADNFDFRWEFFPQGLDQVMVGLFYKNIKGAIENEFISEGNAEITFLLEPENIPHAINYGSEIDAIKYIGDWGAKANFTYTNSNVSTKVQAEFTSKEGHDSVGYIIEKRPLYGQAAGIGNLSLLYRNERIGFHGQLALTYTGDRIYAVSPFAYNDQWQKGFFQLDASAEKKLGGGWSIFAKAHNILNTKVIVYIKALDPTNDNKPEHSASDKTTMVRSDYSEPSYLLGFRFKFN